MAYYICPQCGADIDLDVGMECEYCGYVVPSKKCVSCGKDIPNDADTCPFCGASQTGEVKNDMEPDIAIPTSNNFEEDIFSPDITNNSDNVNTGTIKNDILPPTFDEESGDDIFGKNGIKEEFVSDEVTENTRFENKQDIVSDSESFTASNEKTDELENISNNDVISNIDMDTDITNDTGGSDLRGLFGEEVIEEIIEDEVFNRENDIQNAGYDEDEDSNITEIVEDFSDEHITAVEDNSEDIGKTATEEISLNEELSEEKIDDSILEEVAKNDIMEKSDLGTLETNKDEEFVLDEDIGQKFEEKLGAEFFGEDIAKKNADVEKDVKICPECGFENPAVAKFCLSCGSRLEEKKEEVKVEEPSVVVCPECGYENIPGAKFCMACGSALQKLEEKKEDVEEIKNDLSENVPISNEEKVIPDISEIVDEKIEQKELPVSYSVKVTYDSNNKFQYKFVFNKILEINPEINDAELKVLMSNNTFVISVPAEKFDAFKSELEELDCTVSLIGKNSGDVEAKSSENEKEKTKKIVKEKKIFLLLKGMNSKSDEWKQKFAGMLSLMLNDISKEDAEKMANQSSTKIEMENEKSATDLQVVLTRLGCITQIIEKEVEIEIESEKKIEKEKEEISEEINEDKNVEEIVSETEDMNKNKPVSEEKDGAKEKTIENDIKKETQATPKFLILSGVDKKNWIIREKLAEALADIYPNMTPDIAAGIVSQPVVKLRVKNQKEAESLGERFKEMGWHVRIEDVSAALNEKKRNRKVVNEVDIKKRRKTHSSFLKRERSKKRNYITVAVLVLILFVVGFFVWNQYFVEKYYVLAKADTTNPDVIINASGNPIIYLHATPKISSKKVEPPIVLGTVLRLYDTKVINLDGYDWYKVFVPGFRYKLAYIKKSLAFRCDKDGNILDVKLNLKKNTKLPSPKKKTKNRRR